MTNTKQGRPVRSENEPFRRLIASTEHAAKAVAPMMKCAACANMELVSLAGRRTKAYLDIPSELAQCRGPQDIFAAHAKFWQSMVRDYAEYSQRMVTALQTLDGDVADAGKNGTPERDTLTFPNVFGFPAWQLPASLPGQRSEEDRAA